jgi:ATP-dependent Clp endopeptidase proteolytic subunit ClpP
MRCRRAQDIKLFINSPGGSVTAGMGIYDAMQMCRADVSTVCMGLAASMGAFLLTSGARGKRLSMPNARIMIHQPLGGASGQAVDIEIQAKEIMYHKANLNRLMAFHTGQDVKQIDEDTDRDRYMSPLEAKNYGIIDEMVRLPSSSKPRHHTLPGVTTLHKRRSAESDGEGSTEQARILLFHSHTNKKSSGKAVKKMIRLQAT